MKKVLVSVFALAALAGCASYYDYYKGDVRYTQDGADCIYYTGEAGSRFNNDVRSLNAGKRIVYRNTQCADLYARDTMGMAPRTDRVVIAPSAEYVAAPSCGCNACNGQSVRRKYVFVPAM